MTPPVELFPASELPSRVQYDANGKKCKKAVELEECALKEMIQYSCAVDEKHPKGAVRCWPIIRTFRQYVQPQEIPYSEHTIRCEAIPYHYDHN